MAVIYCPDCRKEMSDTAEMCPNCGYQYAKNLKIYRKALKILNTCNTPEMYLGVAEIFSSVSGIHDADERAAQCRIEANTCRERIAREKQARSEKEAQWRKEEEEKKAEQIAKAKHYSKRGIVGVFAIVIVALVVVVLIIPATNQMKYKRAVSLTQNGDYQQAIETVQSIKDYEENQDVLDLIASCNYQMALGNYNNGQYVAAAEKFMQTLESQEYRHSSVEYLEEISMLLYDAMVPVPMMETDGTGDILRVFDYFDAINDYKDERIPISLELAQKWSAVQNTTLITLYINEAKPSISITYLSVLKNSKNTYRQDVRPVPGGNMVYYRSSDGSIDTYELLDDGTLLRKEIVRDSTDESKFFFMSEKVFVRETYN